MVDMNVRTRPAVSAVSYSELASVRETRLRSFKLLPKACWEKSASGVDQKIDEFFRDES